MWFACKRLRPNQVSAISAHEEPRLEATLAGFDIRSPRGASAGVTVALWHPNNGPSARSPNSGRVKISQKPRWRRERQSRSRVALDQRWGPNGAIGRVSTLRRRVLGDGERAP